VVLENWLNACGPKLYRDEAGDGGDDGGGAGGESGDGGGSDDVQKRIDAAVGGLRKTNEALKAEKQAIKAKLDELSGTFESLGGADGLKQLQDLNAKFANDELGKLLKEGKHDEWFDRRAEGLRKEHAKQLSQHDQTVKQAEERAVAAEKRLHTMLLKTAVQSAAVKAGVEASAFEDVELHAEKRFTFDVERGELVMKDEDGVLVYGKDGKSPLTVAEWLDDQKESRRHWFPASQSGGASGSRMTKAGSGPDLERMTPREYADYMDKKDRERHGQK
jgi:hypothetical protein